MFYENFERICRKRGMSPSAAGLAIGVSKSTPSAWKKNGTIPRGEELKKLADVLDCSVNDFFADHDYENVYFTSDDLSRDEIDLLNVYRKCRTPQQRLKFLGVVGNFLKEEGLS